MTLLLGPGQDWVRIDAQGMGFSQKTLYRVVASEPDRLNPHCTNLTIQRADEPYESPAELTANIQEILESESDRARLCEDRALDGLLGKPLHEQAHPAWDRHGRMQRDVERRDCTRRFEITFRERTAVVLQANIRATLTHSDAWLKSRLAVMENYVQDHCRIGVVPDKETGVGSYGALAQWIHERCQMCLPGAFWSVTVESSSAPSTKPFEQVTYYSDPIDA